MTTNTLNVIHPYLDKATWVFDDPERGLKKEALVAGIPTIIEVATKAAGIVNPQAGFTTIFSDIPFPGYVMSLVKSEHQGPDKSCLPATHNEVGPANIQGTWYEYTAPGGYILEGWLCPALLKYFETPPEVIYIQLTKKGA